MTGARPRPHTPGHRTANRARVYVENVQLINISDSANQAFAAFDWTEHAGKGVRLFVQGFG